MSYRIRKVDDNQRQVVEALRKLGATVQQMHTLGHGCPDLLVSYRGFTCTMEVKDGSKSPSRRVLTPDELEWHRRWQGHAFVVESPSAAVACLKSHSGDTPETA